jgi:signal transduction histidine kinase
MTNMSHKIRTPINSIISFASLLLNEEEKQK